jgi:putative DNA methylase
MTYRKKLIEVALPLEAINAASAREKSIRHGHPSTLHLWWARRPLAAARAVIFTSLVDDPDDPQAPQEFVQACKDLPKGKNAIANDTPRQRLFDFIERLVTWEATTDEEIMEQARELIRLCTNGNPPPLLDPFAGGGSIPLEAQRLGLEAHASDLNPVAVMINKALIEIPPLFAGQPPVNPRDREGTARGGSWQGTAGLAADIRYYGEWIRDSALKRIGSLYPKCNGETVIGWFWARTVKCPNPACGAKMPLVSSFWLSKKRGKRNWIEPKIDPGRRSVSFEVITGKGNPPDTPKVGRGANFSCLICGEIASDAYVKDEGVAGRIGTRLLAIVTEGKSGRNYYSPYDEHKEAASKANPNWTPRGELPKNPRWFSPPLFGMTKYADLFTPRQLVALTTFSDIVSEARQQICNDALEAGMADDIILLRDSGTGAKAYAEAISVFLAMAISKNSHYWSNISTWHAGRETMQGVFARQAIPMVWDFTECNPFSNSSGNLLGSVEWIAKVLETLKPETVGTSIQSDAKQITAERPCLISTDPPYYDNIGYADLSDFFYVWLREELRDIYPQLFSTLLVPKMHELVATPYRFNGDKDAADDNFESGLMKSFVQMRTIMVQNYPMTVYYAFKQQEISLKDGVASTGWETMLTGLIESDFSIVGTWPVRTEMSARSLARGGTNALASSIVLVCRPRPEDAPIISRRDFIRLLRDELPAALREMQSGNIAPVDLAQATIGPGMAVYSRYNKVLEPNGERLKVRTALQMINRELDAYLAEQEGYIDEDSRFAVAWFEQYGFKEGPFGQADVLARAKNTSVEGLSNAGVLESGAGKVRLYHWSELDPGWDPSKDKRLTTWEATHHLIERLNSHGEQGTAQLLAKMPADLAAQARQLAYRLYSICERKGWAEHARDYNTLVISWSTSQEQASVIREQYQQGRLFE